MYQTSDDLSRFIDFAQNNKLWLFPVRADTKLPACKWTHESSPAPIVWRRWLDAGHQLAINAAKSGLLLIDVDAGKLGRDLAWRCYGEFMQSIGSPPLAPYCQSPSGGWHIALWRPADLAPEQLHGLRKTRMTSDVRPLNDGEKDAEAISIRNRGYCVAPGSQFSGRTYAFFDNATIHECPPALVELMRLPVIEHKEVGQSGQSDVSDLAAVIAVLDAAGEFDDEFKWKFEGLAPIKLALGDTEEGRTVARQITWNDVSEDEFLTQWNRFATVDDGTKKLRTVASLIKRAKEITGKNYRVRRSFEAQFGSVSLPVVVSPSVAPAQSPTTHGVSLEDFYAYLPAHQYIFGPTREMWPASSVNSRLGAVAVPMREKPIPAAVWLDVNRPIEQMTWAPGMPMEIRDRLIADGGWITRPGCTCFNLYRPPVIKPVSGDASPWIDHVRFVFGNEADHLMKWLAHRVQRPQEKINHALVLGGSQGIGKDSMLEPIKHAVGPWNFAEVSPVQMLGRFNGFLKSVVLRISEARDLGDTDRFAFYDHAKAYTAAPPDVLRIDEKHLREHSILNVCGIIITTNHKSDGIYLPPDDRRHFVAWSSRSREEFPSDYWNRLYSWFNGGGNEIVAHHLATLDLTGFDPKAPPPKTRAFWEIVDASRTPEDAEMADALDKLGRPAAVTIDALLPKATFEFSEWLKDRRNRRKIPHRLEECGYVPVRNGDASDGLWKIGGRRQAVYARREISVRDQMTAAATLTTARVLIGQSDQSSQ